MEQIYEIPTKGGVLNETECSQELPGKSDDLPALLRILGVILIVAAGTTFLLQSWQGMNHLFRFLGSVGFAGLLLGSGVFLGVKVKEGRGARTFIFLALFSIPILAAQLGGMIYSMFGAGTTNIIAFAPLLDWQSTSLFELGVALFVGGVAALGIALIAFTSILKGKINQAVAILFVANLILLLPGRSDLIVAINLIGISMIYLYAELTLRLGQNVRAGCSAALVRMLFVAPIVVLVGRAALLHDPGFLTTQATMLLAGLGLFVGLPKALEREHGLQHLGAGLIAYVVSALIQRYSPLAVEMAYGTELVSLFGVMGTLAFLSFFIEKNRSLYSKIVLGIFLYTVVDRMFFSTDLIYTVYTILGSALLVVVAYQRKEEGFFVLSVMTFGVALIKYVGLAMFTVAQANPWMTIGCIGIAGIIFASVWEKHHYEIVSFWKSNFSRKLKEPQSNCDNSVVDREVL